MGTFGDSCGHLGTACFEPSHVSPLLIQRTLALTPRSSNHGAGSEEDFFLLKFTFAPNEFFTNTELTKTYFVDVAAEEGELMYGGPSYKRAEGCKIDWKPNMNPTIKKVRCWCRCQC